MKIYIYYYYILMFGNYEGLLCEIFDLYFGFDV